jgi:hypothetical protein
MEIVLNQKNSIMKINYELQAKKNEVKGELGYGLMWLFIVALIEVIPYIKGFESIFYHIIAVPAGLVAIYKFYIGITYYKKINN